MTSFEDFWGRKVRASCVPEVMQQPSCSPHGSRGRRRGRGKAPEPRAHAGLLPPPLGSPVRVDVGDFSCAVCVGPDCQSKLFFCSAAAVPPRGRRGALFPPQGRLHERAKQGGTWAERESNTQPGLLRRSSSPTPTEMPCGHVQPPTRCGENVRVPGSCQLPPWRYQALTCRSV